MRSQFSSTTREERNICQLLKLGSLYFTKTTFGSGHYEGTGKYLSVNKYAVNQRNVMAILFCILLSAVFVVYMKVSL